MSNHETEKRHPLVQLWSIHQARRAAPYITRVLRSLRQNWLEARSEHRTAEQLEQKPGRPNRKRLLAYAEAVLAARKAEEAFVEVAEEMRDLGIAFESPISGEVLLPCIHQETLAWIIFDLFADDPLRCWRFAGDPACLERPISELLISTEQLLA